MKMNNENANYTGLSKKCNIAMFKVLYVIVNDHPKFNLRYFDTKILKLV